MKNGKFKKKDKIDDSYSKQETSVKIGVIETNGT